MLVKFWMTDNVITIDEDVSIVKALKLMKEHGIQHLPVMKNSPRVLRWRRTSYPLDLPKIALLLVSG
jgi:CBS-domain-containing membrane protein